jgi:hypothetical protein
LVKLSDNRNFYMIVHILDMLLMIVKLTILFISRSIEVLETVVMGEFIRRSKGQIGRVL